MKFTTKKLLYEACLLYINDRITSLETLIRDIQQSANEETKSTAGDKYETARSMAQLEVDKYRMQLSEAGKMKQELLRITVDSPASQIKPGSLIFTSRGNFYISINAGQHTLESQLFFAVSTGSPIAQKMMGLQVHDSFTLNNLEYRIQEIQ